MWTSIFLFLCTIGIIKHKSTSIPIGCAKRVQRCPVEGSQWVQKTEQLKCVTHYGYVCLRDWNGYLFETCMANFVIQANLGNCPILFACLNNEPYLGTISTFYRCPMEVSGCPPKNHTQYSIQELYKYPKCVESNFSDAIGNISARSTTSISRTTLSTSHINEQDNKHVIIVIFVFTVLLTIAGCCIGYIGYSRKTRRRYAKDIREEMEGLSEDIVNSRKEKYDYSTVTRGEIECLSEEDLRRWIQSINESEADKVLILPLKENDTIEIDRIYVPVSIVDENEIRTSRTPNKQTISEITPNKMFYIKPGMPARFIFLLGDAGYGKTVQCQRITKSWCKAWKTENRQSKKQGNTEKDEAWERSLKEFDFLLFVPIRDLNSIHWCVDDMLFDYYRRFDTSHQHLADILAVLKDERYKCLIILDGLDEWNISEHMKGSLLHKGIPNCEGMPSCTFLISMRSWRFMEVDPLCRQGLFDKVVRLQGLYDNGIEELTTNMLCNHFNMERNSKEFHEQFQSIRKKASLVSFKSLMKIPLLAVFFILTWHENIETGQNLTTSYLSMIETLIKRSFKLQTEQKGRDDHGSSVSSILENFFCVKNRMPEISRLGKIAFNDFTSQNATFVLSDVQFRNSEVNKTVNFFLRIGLLRRSCASGKIHENYVRISFLHKTVQEFIFSLCLCQGSVEADILKFVFKEVKDI